MDLIGPLQPDAKIRFRQGDMQQALDARADRGGLENLRRRLEAH